MRYFSTTFNRLTYLHAIFIFAAAQNEEDYDILCRCFTQVRNSRFEMEPFSCGKLHATSDTKSDKALAMTVVFEVRCPQSQIEVQEVAVQCLNEDGLPFGLWEPVEMTYAEKCDVGGNSILIRARRPATRECLANPLLNDTTPQLYFFDQNLVPRVQYRQYVLSFCATWYLDTNSLEDESKIQFTATVRALKGSDLEDIIGIVRSPIYEFSTRRKHFIKLMNSAGNPMRIDVDETYVQAVNESSQCVEPVEQPSPFVDEMCLKFNRAPFIESDAINCFFYTFDFDTQLFSVNYGCPKLYLVKEFAFTALNQDGLPIGRWELPQPDEYHNRWCEANEYGPVKIPYKPFIHKCPVPNPLPGSPVIDDSADMIHFAGPLFEPGRPSATLCVKYIYKQPTEAESKADRVYIFQFAGEAVFQNLSSGEVFTAKLRGRDLPIYKFHPRARSFVKYDYEKKYFEYNIRMNEDYRPYITETLPIVKPREIADDMCLCYAEPRDAKVVEMTRSIKDCIHFAAKYDPDRNDVVVEFGLMCNPDAILLDFAIQAMFAPEFNYINYLVGIPFGEWSIAETTKPCAGISSHRKEYRKPRPPYVFDCKAGFNKWSAMRGSQLFYYNRKFESENDIPHVCLYWNATNFRNLGDYLFTKHFQFVVAMHWKDIDSDESYVTQYYKLFEFKDQALDRTIKKISVHDLQVHLHEEFRNEIKGPGDCLPEIEFKDDEYSCLCLSNIRQIKFETLGKKKFSYTSNGKSSDCFGTSMDPMLQSSQFEREITFYFNRNCYETHAIHEVFANTLNEKGFPIGYWNLSDPSKCFTNRGAIVPQPFSRPCGTFNSPWKEGSEPMMLHFTKRLQPGRYTASKEQDPYLSFCAIWVPYSTDEYKYIQVVTHLHVEDLETGEHYITSLRSTLFESSPSGFQIPDTGFSSKDLDVLPDEKYFQHIKQTKQCLAPVPPPPPEEEVCVCYADGRGKYVPMTDEFENCFKFTVNHNHKLSRLKSIPLSGNLVVIVANHCEDKYLVKDVALQAVDQFGLPKGRWEDLAEYHEVCEYRVEGSKRVLFRRPQLAYGPFQEDCILPLNPDLVEKIKEKENPAAYYFRTDLSSGDPSKEVPALCAIWAFTEDGPSTDEIQIIVNLHVQDLSNNSSFITKLKKEALKYTKSGGETPYEPTDKKLSFDPVYNSELEEYRNNKEEETRCLDPVTELLPPLGDELCKCFAKERNLSVEEPGTDFEKRNCIDIRITPKNIQDPVLKYEYIITVKYECPDLYQIEELAIQAINEFGMPFGFWDSVPKTELDVCESAYDEDEELNLRILTTTEPFKHSCPRPNSRILQFYMLQDEQPEIFHYNRRLKSPRKPEASLVVCARWRPGLFYGIVRATRVQFLVQGVLQNTKKEEKFISKFRSKAYAYRLGTMRFHKIYDPAVYFPDHKVELNRKYLKILNELKNNCLKVVEPPEILDEICRCYAEYERPEFKKATDEIEKCFNLDIVNDPSVIKINESTITVRARLRAECDKQFEIKEVVVEALQANGMPYGEFLEVPYQELEGCQLSLDDYTTRRPKGNFSRPCLDPVTPELQEYYFKPAPPRYLYFNYNLTIGIGIKGSRPALCIDWLQRINEDQKEISIQFVAEAVIMNLFDRSEFVTSFHSKLYTLNLGTDQKFEEKSQVVKLNRDYYDEIVDSVEIDGANFTCAPYEPLPPPLDEELCFCYSQIRFPRKEMTSSDYFYNCVDFHAWEYKGNAFTNKRTMLTSFRFTCEATRVLRDIAMMAIDSDGNPVGRWEDVLRADFDECVVPYDEEKPHTLRKPLRPYKRNCPAPPNNTEEFDALSANFKYSKSTPQVYHFVYNLTSEDGPGILPVICHYWWFDENAVGRDPIFQFLIEAYVHEVENPTTTGIVAVFRSPKYQYLTDTETFVQLYQPVQDYHHELRRDYADFVNETDICLPLLPTHLTITDELCQCYDRLRVPLAAPTTEALYATGRLTQCTVFETAQPYPGKILVSVTFRQDCLPETDRGRFYIHEVAVQAISRDSNPVGVWDQKLRNGKIVACIEEVPEDYTSFVVKCHQEGPLRGEVFVFQNLWMDDYTRVCIDWELTDKSTSSYSGDDLEFQFYGSIFFEERVPQDGDPRDKRTQVITTMYSVERYGSFILNDGKYVTLVRHKLENEEDINFPINREVYDPIRETECIPVPGKPQRYTNVCALHRPSTAENPRVDLDGDGELTPLIKRLRPCFAMDAFPHSHPNWMHIRFRQYPRIGGPNCRNYVGTEVAISAFNEEGYPSGVAQRSFEFYRYLDEKGAEFCLEEDLRINYPNKIKLDSLCWFGQSVNNQSKFLQSGGRFEGDTPTVLLIANPFSYNKGGFCATWKYDTDLKVYNQTPKFIQFVADIFVPRAEDPNGNQGVVVTLRSPKMSFKYREIPQPVGGAATGVPTRCHDPYGVPEIFAVPKPTEPEELYIYNIHFDKDLYRHCVRPSNRQNCNPHFTIEVPPIIVQPGITIVNNLTEEDFNSTESSGGFVTPRPEIDLPRPDQIFDGCLRDKGCISSTVKTAQEERECLLKRSCRMVVAFGKLNDEENDDDEIVVEIYGKSDGIYKYIAMGLSVGGGMGEDYVIECVREGFQMKLYNSWNLPNANINIRLIGENSHENNTRFIQGISVDRELYCKYYLKRKFEKFDPVYFKNYTYDVDIPYYILMVTGSKAIDGDEGNLLKHKLSGTYNATRTTRLGETFQPVGAQRLFLRLHGVFMTITYGFLLPVGAFIARYFRKLLKERSIKDFRRFVIIHVTFIIVSGATQVFSYVFLLLGKTGWTSLQEISKHATYGYVCTGLFAFQLLIAFGMEKDRHGTEILVLNCVHPIIGHAIVLLGTYVISGSRKIQFSFLSCGTHGLVVTWIVVYFTLHVLMSLQYLWIDHIALNFEYEIRWNVIGVKSLLMQLHHGKKISPKGVRIRYWMLLIFSACSLAFTLIMAALHFFPKCYSTQQYFEFGINNQV